MSNPLHIETDNELHEAIANNDVVVVNFSAPAWCVPCRRLAPHFAATAAKFPDVTFVEVDIDKSEALRSQYDVMSVPFLVAFKGGNLVGEVKGRTALQLSNEVGQILSGS